MHRQAGQHDYTAKTYSRNILPKVALFGLSKIKISASHFSKGLTLTKHVPLAFVILLSPDMAKIHSLANGAVIPNRYKVPFCIKHAFFYVISSLVIINVSSLEPYLTVLVFVALPSIFSPAGIVH